MATLFGLYPFLLKLYADGGYQGPAFQTAMTSIMRLAKDWECLNRKARAYVLHASIRFMLRRLATATK
jgi:hypothetical protein